MTTRVCSKTCTTCTALPLGMVDASVVAIAERRGVREIATHRSSPLQRCPTRACRGIHAFAVIRTIGRGHFPR